MTLSYLQKAKNELSILDKPVQKRIKKYLDEVEKLENPRSRGKALSANLAGLWRYRVGDYRIICRIQDDELIVCVVDVGHRKDVYVE